MVADATNITAAITFVVLAWGTNLATDCFKTCRDAFARFSRNIYTEKMQQLRGALGVE